MNTKLRALLDTNVFIHRETMNPSDPQIGVLFYWLDKLGYAKWIHPITQAEIKGNKNQKAVKSFEIKMGAYQVLNVPGSIDPRVQSICDPMDITINDKNDTKILNEVYCSRVNILITEDKKIAVKAAKLGIGNKVYSANRFLEEALQKHPGLVSYDVLAIERIPFSQINLDDPFFDSLKSDYPTFIKWFNDKISDEDAYALIDKDRSIKAFLYLKIEDTDEDYSDINPVLRPAERLKIGTLKVTKNGMKIGERFLKIAFDNAKAHDVEEIYVTIFDRTEEHKKLIRLLEAWGFTLYGVKTTTGEHVYVRPYSKTAIGKLNRIHPKLTYPYISQAGNQYMIAIQGQFHTRLFPDSILRGENKDLLLDLTPYGNALSKCFISSSKERSMQPGDGLVFFRTGTVYTNVATTIGVVESVTTEFKDEYELIEKTKGRTVFTPDELVHYYRTNKKFKPFVINFLYIGSLKRPKPTLKEMLETGILKSMPKPVFKIPKDAFVKLYQRM